MRDFLASFAIWKMEKKNLHMRHSHKNSPKVQNEWLPLSHKYFSAVIYYTELDMLACA